MKKKMVKCISVIFMAMMMFICCLLSSCGIGSRFESDGKFEYYYDEYRGGYAIVGTEDAGFSDPMYIPAYYKGKPVVATGYYQESYMGGGGKRYCIDYGTSLKRYYPFTLKTTYSFVGVGEKYIPSTESDFQYVELEISKTNDIVIYLSSILFKKTIETILNDNINHKNAYGKELFEYIEKDVSFKFRYLGSQIKMTELKTANTAYMFNYEGSPNSNYFFINNFNDGALIENTPYEPLREGYVFDGWYKEAECINKCNFETDIYVEQYDENGELIFNELKLYAKWIKS